MRHEKRFFILMFLWVFTFACNKLSPPPAVQERGVPLQQKWVAQTDSEIYRVVASDRWVAVATASHLIAVDMESGDILWKKEFDIDLDSKLLFLDGILIAMNSTTISLIAKSGIEAGHIILDTETESAEVVAAIEHYIFVIRRPTWTLEVYDTNVMSLAWSTSIERGGIRIYQGDIPGMAYIITPSRIIAVGLSAGKVVWQFHEEIIAGTYDSGVIYYAGYLDHGQSMYLAALSALEGKGIWKKNIPLQYSRAFLTLSTIDAYLIATSQTELIAFDKSDGSYLWEAEAHDQFPISPVQLDNLIYVRAPISRKIYAIALGEGSTVGYIQFGAATILSQSTNEYTSEIYQYGETIVFSGRDAVYRYGK